MSDQPMSDVPKGISDRTMMIGWAVFFVVALIVGHLSGNIVKEYDWGPKVKEVCGKDGGLTIRETDYISRSLYRKLAGEAGELVIPTKSEATADAPFFTETARSSRYNTRGDPGIVREETRFIRRDDNRTIADYVTYFNERKETAPPGECGSRTLPKGLAERFIVGV